MAIAIHLTEQEKRWIKLLKWHYRDTYPVNARGWIETLKPMFEEIYGYSPDEHIDDFRGCIFTKLLDIWLKIHDDESGSNVGLKSIFNEAFYKSLRREYDLPIDRAIAELCGQIQCTSVLNNDGSKRFDIDLHEDTKRNRRRIVFQ